jgi:hypothetical protein
MTTALQESATVRRSLWLVATLVPLVASCSRYEGITRDTSPESEQITPEVRDAVPTSSPAAAADSQRTLGAIILIEDAGWLFQLSGDPAAIQSVREDFVQFVKSVRFTDGVNPNLFLRDGWGALPGDDSRLATITVPSGAHVLELALSRLPRDGETPDDEYVLATVNRWREQMGLDPIQASELSSETERMKAGVRDMVLVDLVDTNGTTSGFAGGTTPARRTDRENLDAEFPIEFDAPPEWVAEYDKKYRVAKFTAVHDGLQSVAITVRKGGGGRVSTVVNLWRSHVDLPPWSADEMFREVRKIETLGTTGDYVELIGREQTILGVIAQAGGDQWHIKLWGNPEPAERERFEAFVKSLRFRN